MESTITFERIGGQTVTATLHNTMRQMITVRWMQATHAEGEPDEDLRNAYCWLASYAVSLTGMSAKQVLVGYGCNREDFDAAYLSFSEQVDEANFWKAVNGVTRLRRRTDPIEKPDSELTPDEEADPNS